MRALEGGKREGGGTRERDEGDGGRRGGRLVGGGGGEGWWGEAGGKAGGGRRGGRLVEMHLSWRDRDSRFSSFNSSVISSSLLSLFLASSFWDKHAIMRQSQ